MVSVRKAAKQAAEAKRATAAKENALPIFCSLNQSLWDIYSSPPPSPPRHAAAADPETPLLTSPPPPPPPFQFDSSPGRKRYFAKRTAANVVGADDSGGKMKKKRSAVISDGNKAGDGTDVGFKEEKELVGFKEDDANVDLCPKLDRKGWQCGSLVKKGKRFCDEHLPASSSGERPSRGSKMSPTYFSYVTSFRAKKQG